MRESAWARWCVRNAGARGRRHERQARPPASDMRSSVASPVSRTAASGGALDELAATRARPSSSTCGREAQRVKRG